MCLCSQFHECVYQNNWDGWVRYRACSVFMTSTCNNFAWRRKGVCVNDLLVFKSFHWSKFVENISEACRCFFNCFEFLKTSDILQKIKASVQFYRIETPKGSCEKVLNYLNALFIFLLHVQCTVFCVFQLLQFSHWPKRCVHDNQWWKICWSIPCLHPLWKVHTWINDECCWKNFFVRSVRSKYLENGKHFHVFVEWTSLWVLGHLATCIFAAAGHLIADLKE